MAWATGYARNARAIEERVRRGYDAESLPFPAARFDAAINWMTLRLLPDLQAAVSELARDGGSRRLGSLA